jgi:hypothetical protein
MAYNPFNAIDYLQKKKKLFHLNTGVTPPVSMSTIASIYELTIPSMDKTELYDKEA